MPRYLIGLCEVSGACPSITRESETEGKDPQDPYPGAAPIGQNRDVKFLKLESLFVN